MKIAHFSGSKEAGRKFRRHPGWEPEVSLLMESISQKVEEAIKMENSIPLIAISNLCSNFIEGFFEPVESYSEEPPDETALAMLISKLEEIEGLLSPFTQGNLSRLRFIAGNVILGFSRDVFQYANGAFDGWSRKSNAKLLIDYAVRQERNLMKEGVSVLGDAGGGSFAVLMSNMDMPREPLLEAVEVFGERKHFLPALPLIFERRRVLSPELVEKLLDLIPKEEQVDDIAEETLERIIKSPYHDSKASSLSRAEFFEGFDKGRRLLEQDMKKDKASGGTTFKYSKEKVFGTDYFFIERNSLEWKGGKSFEVQDMLGLPVEKMMKGERELHMFNMEEPPVNLQDALNKFKTLVKSGYIPVDSYYELTRSSRNVLSEIIRFASRNETAMNTIVENENARDIMESAVRSDWGAPVYPKWGEFIEALVTKEIAR